jgi:hypothetical protein
MIAAARSAPSDSVTMMKLPTGTIPTTGGEVLAVLSDGGFGNAFYDRATTSLTNLGYLRRQFSDGV